MAFASIIHHKSNSTFSHNELPYSRILTPPPPHVEKYPSSWVTSIFAGWMQTVSMLMCVQLGQCVCVCVCVYGMGSVYAGLRGWVCSTSSHTPSTAPGVVDEFFSHAVWTPPAPPPRNESMLTEQLLRWTHTHRITHTPTHTHRHAVKSAVFPFDQAGVPYVSSGKIRRWCLRWLRVCVPMWACERGPFCRLSYRYGSTLVSVSVVLHFK